MPRKRLVAEKAKEVSTDLKARGSSVKVMLAVSIVFVLLSVAYNALTPPVTPFALHRMDGGSANADETAHLLYVSTVASGHLPVFSVQSADYEAHQPPLYYAFAAIFYHLSKNIHFVRLSSTILGLALLWAVYVTVRDFFPENEDLAVAASLTITLLPMNVALSASVSNDMASNLVFVLYLYFVGRLMRGSKASFRDLTFLAIVIAAGVWIKSSTLLLLPLTGIAIAAALRKNITAWKGIVVASCSVVASAGVLSLPWLLRNQLLYGDLFAQKVVFHDLASRNIAPATLISALGPNWYLERFFGWTFASYWGVFDSMTLFMPTNVYVILAAVSLPAVLIGVIALIKSKKLSVDQAVLTVWAGLTFLTLIAFVQYNQHFFQVQGRYLYPALVPLTVAGVVGVNGFVPISLRTWINPLLFAGLVLLNTMCLYLISGRFSA